MRRFVPTPSTLIAALALCAQGLCACSEECPDGFRREGSTCEPIEQPGQREDPSEPEADGGSTRDAGARDAAADSGGPTRAAADAGAGGAAGRSEPARICEKDQVRCAADALQRCNDSGSAWENVDTCEPGKCDVAAKACLVCTPGASTCEGKQLVTCDARGVTSSARACEAPTALCQNGACVECTVDSDCAADMCTRRTCTAGKCSAPKPALFGSECVAPTFDNELPGQCTAQGVCAPVIAIRVAARAAGDGTPINQAYVSASPDGFLRAAGMNGGPPGPWEPMLLIREQPGSERVQLFSLSNQGYVTPVLPGPVPEGKPLPDALWLGSQASEPETFVLSDPKLGKQVTIRSVSDGHYWSAEDWRETPSDYVVRLRADSTQLGPWEHFTLIPYGN